MAITSIPIQAPADMGLGGKIFRLSGEWTITQEVLNPETIPVLEPHPGKVLLRGRFIVVSELEDQLKARLEVQDIPDRKIPPNSIFIVHGANLITTVDEDLIYEIHGELSSEVEITDPNSEEPGLIPVRMWTFHYDPHPVLKTHTQKAETKARRTLKKLIGEKEYIRYLANECVQVFGKSGRMYKVYPGDRETEVYNKSGKIGRVCVVVGDSTIPPTDSILMRVAMIQSDECGFYDESNLFGGIKKPCKKINEN